MSKQLYIHVGMPKTGSSAIQALLSLNEKLLNNSGYSYGNSTKLDSIFQISTGNAWKLYEYINNRDVQSIQSFLDENVNKVKEDKVILSSEGLYFSMMKQPKFFIEILNSYDFKIIIYVRRQDEWAISSYKQQVKNHDFCKDIELSNYYEPFDFYTVLSNVLKYTDKKRIVVRPYEKEQFYNNNIYEDFLHILNIQLTREFIYPNKYVNPSLNRIAFEFRKVVNKLELDKNEGMKKAWLNNLLTLFSVEYPDDKESQKLFSVSERKQLIEKYSKKNAIIAKEFLGREDGKLFTKEINADDYGKTNYTLTKENLELLFKFLIDHIKELRLEQRLYIYNVIRHIKKEYQFGFDKALEDEYRYNLSELDKESKLDNHIKRIRKTWGIDDSIDDGCIYREIALLLESLNAIEEAFYMMNKAKMLRPNGPFIKEKCIAYKKMLEINK